MPRNKQFDPEVVLEKAKILFWEKGYHATSMENLVQGLGINRASMYSSFGNKLDLYIQALTRYHKQQAAFQAAFLYEQLYIRQGLYLLFEKWVDEEISDAQERGCFLQNSICEMASQNPALNELQKNFVREIEGNYQRYLQYGVNQGQLSPYKELTVLSKHLFHLQMQIKTATKVNSQKSDLMKLVQLSLSVLN